MFACEYVPAADVVYYAACCIILLAMLQKMIGSFNLPSILSTGVRVLIASAVAFVVSYFAGLWLPVGEGMIGGFLRLHRHQIYLNLVCNLRN